MFLIFITVHDNIMPGFYACSFLKLNMLSKRNVDLNNRNMPLVVPGQI